MLPKHKEKTLPNAARDTVVYRCTECGLAYREKETAEQCRLWCATHHSCNLDIIKHAINPAPSKKE